MKEQSVVVFPEVTAVVDAKTVPLVGVALGIGPVGPVNPSPAGVNINLTPLLTTGVLPLMYVTGTLK